MVESPPSISIPSWADVPPADESNASMDAAGAKPARSTDLDVDALLLRLSIFGSVCDAVSGGNE